MSKNNENKAVILVAPQGAGKGTQESIVKDWLSKLVTGDIIRMSTGDIFRASCGTMTSTGKTVGELIDGGDMVPDVDAFAVVDQFVHDQLAKGTTGFIWDGFPRNVSQMEWLLNQLSVWEIELSAVIHLTFSDETAKTRIGGRRACKGCPENYHIEYKPSKVEGVCDKCGGELYLREDDTPEGVGKRLDIYHKSTEPVLDLVPEELIVTVSAEPGIVEVGSALKKTLEDLI